MQIEFSQQKSIDQNEKEHQSPQKRRGRPQKKPQPFFEEGDQLFTIHDNIFHAAILFYTFRIFDSAPTRKKFNPTIGFSVYQKVKNFPIQLKRYYDDDQVALNQASAYIQNFHLKNFFINSMTFGPKCVIDEFYQIFHFILNKLDGGSEVTAEICLEYIKDTKLKYLNFNNSVLDFLEAKTPTIRQNLQQIINNQLQKLLQIIIHTLDCLLNKQKSNNYSNILQSQEDMFERGVHSKTKKKVKKQ